MATQDYDDPKEIEPKGSGPDEPPEPDESGAVGDEHEEDVECVAETADNQSDELAGFGAEEADADDEIFAEDENLIQLKTQIEEKLCTCTAHREGVQAEGVWSGAGNIVGVGLSIADEAECGALGVDPGVPTLNIYVAEPVGVDQVKAALVDGLHVQGVSSDNVPVNVIHTGVLEAQRHTFKLRPAPGGISVGHFRITAGTLGCLARGRSRARRRRQLILSNNHVLADSNKGRFGDSILQPGRVDGGIDPRDRIAALERFVPIKFGGAVNHVDAATAWAKPSLVRKELVYLQGGARRFFRISSRIRVCRRSLFVGKSGRTTQLTRGRVTDCSASVWINYGAGRLAFFRDQIIVKGIGRPFSAGGDSGSVVWTWDRQRNPVGLLFGGSSSHTICNKIGNVLRALDISLVT